MKKIFFIILIFAGTVNINAQILTNNGSLPLITNSNIIVDASTLFSTESGAGANVGKGIIIPSVNLVNFEFDLTLADGITFPTYFDGMVVYNNATGTTQTTGNRSSTATAVTPGFYYFFNPNGANSGNVTGGLWKSLGGSAGGSAGLTAAGSGLSETSGTVHLGGTLTRAAEIITQSGFNFYTTGVGKVGIGVAPTGNSAKFEVNGAATNTSAYNANASQNIDFSNSNLAYTTASAGAFTLTNVKDGGTYTLAVQGTVSGTSTFTATNTANASLTVKILNNKATITGTQTLYTIIVMGTTVYVFVNSGF